MRHRNARAVGGLLLSLGLALPGCTIRIEPGQGGSPTVTASFSGAMNETETLAPRRIEVGAAPTVVVDNRVGPVTLTAGEAGTLVVEAVKRASSKDELEKIKLAVDQAGDTVTIRWDVDPEAITRGQVELTIKAPAASALRVKTGNGSVKGEGFGRGADVRTGVGSITLKDVSGDLALHTGNGSIEATGAEGAVVADTGVGSITVKGTRGSRTLQAGNGSIDADGAEGPVSARTSTGRIRLGHTKGDLSLTTGNGSIEVDQAEGSIVAETGVGSVDASGRFTGNCAVTTGNGSIVVALPKESRLTVDAGTGNGGVSNGFGLPVSGRVSRHSTGKLGDGSEGSLRLKTGVGSIELKAR